MDAEIPGAIVMLADPTNYGPRPADVVARGSYDLVVVHGTSGHNDPRNTAAMWQKPNARSSAHLVIGEPTPGQIVVVQCIPLRFQAYHAHHEVDPRSIGVEHCIRAPGTLGPDDPGLPPSEALYLASARVVAYVLKAGGFVPDRATTVRGHAEVDRFTTHTACPIGDGWDWTTYVPLLQAAYDVLGEPPAVA